MGRIAIVSVNLNNFDTPTPPVKQSVPADYLLLDDSNFPLRTKALAVRAQAGIPKMFAWQLFPGYDYYIWQDSSVAMVNPDTVKWFLEQLGDSDMAIFKHPTRKTLRGEFDYMKYRMANGDNYLLDRYEGEFIDDLEEVIFSDPDFKDDTLYASTSFIYRDCSEIREAMRDWWYYKTRYHVHDQLSLPYVLRNCNVNMIYENLYKNPYLIYVRKK